MQVKVMFERSKIRELKGHKEKVHTVAWNSDGRRLASGSVDKTARVWMPHRGVSQKNPVKKLDEARVKVNFWLADGHSVFYRTQRAYRQC